MPELTQSQYEALQVARHEAHQRFLATLADNPACREAYRQWMLADRALVEGGRARRASEVHSP